MANIFTTTDENFGKSFSEFLQVNTDDDAVVVKTVQDIIADVRARGDKAIIELTEKFDQRECSLETLMIDQARIQEAIEQIDDTLVSHLQQAADRIKAYHEKQLPEDFSYTDEEGILLGNCWKAVEKAGIYVPGGLASYPSSVLMNAIPAKVAGVKKIVMVVPTPKGEISSLVLAAANIAGIDTIYSIGGAQAIAALAYGTQTIQKVDLIAGPGNIYVATAKKLVYGQVGIDMVAGPSEILVIADGKNNPSWIAADLLSQAEHDTQARPILVTDDKAFAQQVIKEIEENILPTLPKKNIASESWSKHGAVVITRSLEEAVEVSNNVAPEHLEIATDSPEILAKRVTNAGAVFLGRYTPEAIGDYIAGPSHVLPTAGTARFSSGLSVFTYLKRMSIIGCSQSALTKIAPATIALAKEEGLDAHALSVSIRQDT